MALRENYLHAMFKAVFTEMSGLLIKDISRKVEFIAFEKLEKFWAEKEKRVCFCSLFFFNMVFFLF